MHSRDVVLKGKTAVVLNHTHNLNVNAEYNKIINYEKVLIECLRSSLVKKQSCIAQCVKMWLTLQEWSIVKKNEDNRNKLKEVK